MPKLEVRKRKANDVAELKAESNGEYSKARSESEKESMKLEVRKWKASGQRNYKLGKRKANGN